MKKRAFPRRLPVFKSALQPAHYITAATAFCQCVRSSVELCGALWCRRRAEFKSRTLSLQPLSLHRAVFVDPRSESEVYLS